MELRPGYKRTAAGPIPEDWELVPLGERGLFRKGAGIRKDQANSGDIPCIRYGELYTDHHEVIRQFRSRVSPDVAATARPLNKGDIVFAASGETKEEIGKCAVFLNEFPAVAGGDTIIFAPAEDDPHFLGYALNQPIAARHKAALGQGDAVVHISTKALQRLVVPLPPKPEQRAIAGALADMDAMIGALTKLLVKKRDLRTATMQRLLSGEQRLAGFSEQWSFAKLGDCLTAPPSYGINAPAVPLSDTLPRYIRITDITEEGDYLPKPPVSVESHNTRYVLRPGDIVFARTGATTGKTYLYDPEDGQLVYAGFLILARPDPEKLVSKFLAAYTTTEFYWDWVKTVSMRSGQPGINGQQFARLEIPLPPVDEQLAIAEVITAADQELALLQARIKKTKALKQAMMQALLTGRVRLPVKIVEDAGTELACA